MKKTFFMRTGSPSAAQLVHCFAVSNPETGFKIKFLITGLFLSGSLASFAQNAVDILKKSYDKCQSIQNGYYEMDQYMKFMSNTDTSLSSYTCHFRKLKNDSLFSSAFHYEQSRKGKVTAEVFYTGNDFVFTNTWDSTTTIMSKTMWAKEIKLIRHNFTFYSPLTSRKSYPILHDTDFIDNTHTFEIVGEETVNTILCYHIKENEMAENDSSDPMKTLRVEYHYWINKSDFIPVQYSNAIDVVMDKDTMYQYELHVLNKYEINKPQDENTLTLNSLPAYYRAKDYALPLPKPLLKDTFAPSWQLLSVAGEKVSLDDLKGRLVLIDFFYKSCYPCMLAAPALQALHDKYKDKGLTIIGIDPYDKKEDGIAAFLEKKGITYTVLLGGKDAAIDYRVSAYPTMYLIDKNGKVIFSQEGYSKEMESTLEEIILKNL